MNGQLNEATELNRNLKAQLDSLQKDIEQNDEILQKDENVELKNLPNNDKMEELD